MNTHKQTQTDYIQGIIIKKAADGPVHRWRAARERHLMQNLKRKVTGSYGLDFLITDTKYPQEPKLSLKQKRTYEANRQELLKRFRSFTVHDE